MNAQHHHNTRKHRAIQVRFTRTVLGIATVVAVTILFVLAAKAVGTMFITGTKMWIISDNVSYYEEQREFALETGRGNFATQCDDNIRALYADRNALINSEDPVVAFTAVHKWYAMGIIFAFVAFMVAIVRYVMRNPERTIKFFTNVIYCEEFLVRVAVAAVSFILMVVFKLIGISGNRLSEAFTLVWNQSRPRRKPTQKPKNVEVMVPRHEDNVIRFPKRA